MKTMGVLAGLSTPRIQGRETGDGRQETGDTGAAHVDVAHLRMPPPYPASSQNLPNVVEYNNNRETFFPNPCSITVR